VPSVGGYFYAQKDRSIYINLFAEGDAEFKIAGQSVKLQQNTEYPWEGRIDVTVLPEKTAEFEVRVRIPGWAIEMPIPSDLYTFVDKSKSTPKIFLNGKEHAMKLDHGYVVFNRKWKKGDKITIDLPMEIRKIKGHEKIEADKDKLTYEKGPLVYAAEWADNKDKKVLNLVVPLNATITYETKADLLQGVDVLKATGKSVSRISETETKTTDAELTLIPYYAWAHRGTGEMTVWIPEKAGAAQPLAAPTIASSSKVSGSEKRSTLMALNDQMVPKNSNDQSIIFYHWWPLKDTVQYVQYDFEKPETITSSSVYWFDDGPFGGCRIPAGWRLLYKQGEAWVPVKNNAAYDVVKDAQCTVSFQSVTTSALRMEITLPKEHSSGMMEWSVK
jgi:hypothetical protein